MRKPLLISILALLLFATAYAQQPNVATITNIGFACPDGIALTYSLTCAQPVDSVTLYYSPNKRDWRFAKTVTGDHYNQSAGTGKPLFWDNFADKVRFGKFYFKLEVPQPDTCTADDCVMINGVCWAKTNLDVGGVFCANPEDYGALYQWGRRTDGHESITSPCWPLSPPCGSTACGTVSTLDGDGQVPAGPAPYGSFIRAYNCNNGDWRTPQDDNLWNSGTESVPEKTVNDPCPCGWRAPTNSELQSLANSGSSWSNLNGVPGRFFGSGGNTLFLPAAGDRSRSSGSLVNLGTSGYYWSSSANGITSYNLYFSGSTVYLDSNEGRAFGLSVRCVAEN